MFFPSSSQSSAASSSCPLNPLFENSSSSSSLPFLIETNTILSIYAKNNRFGAAFYLPEENNVYIRPEYSENFDLFPICQSLLRVTNPTVVLANNNSSTMFQEYLKNAAKLPTDTSFLHLDLEDDSSDDDSHFRPNVFHSNTRRKAENGKLRNKNNDIVNPFLESDDNSDTSSFELPRTRFELTFLTYTYYSLQECKQLLMQCKFRNFQTTSEQDLEIFLNEVINFSDQHAFKALSALIKHLHQMHLNQITLNEEYHHFSLNSMFRYYEPCLLYIDSYSYQSLEIFKDDYHPAIGCVNRHRRPCESLFQMFNRCRSKIGRKQMELVFLSPLTDHQTLICRYKVVQFFVDRFGSEMVQNIRKHLTRVQSFSNFIKASLMNRLKGRDWVTFNQTLQSIKEISSIVEEYSGSIELFAEINAFVRNEEFEQIVTMLEEIVDFEQTSSRNSFVPVRGLHAELDELRDQAVTMENKKSQILTQQMLLLADDIESIELIYISNHGFALKVLEKFNSRIDKQTHLIALPLLSTNQYTYYTTKEILSLNKTYVDLPLKIASNEQIVMHCLVNEIYDNLMTIRPKLQLMAMLDVLLSFADVAVKHGFARPIINQSADIQIIKGRHPILEYYSKDVVSNDFISSERHRMLIVTGANCCGKSIYLKQNCIIVFLAHIGSFVPAQFCKIGKITKILTHIYTNDSLETRMGSFAFECLRLRQIINYSDATSMVAIDEFGRSTRPADGYVLLLATVIYLLKHPNSPHTMVSTHFYKICSEIKSERVAFKTFDLVENDEFVHFKYQLKFGSASEESILNVVCKLLSHPFLVERIKYVYQRIKTGRAINKVRCDEHNEEVEQCLRLANELIDFCDKQEDSEPEGTDVFEDSDDDSQPKDASEVWAEEQLSHLEEIIKHSQLTGKRV